MSPVPSEINGYVEMLMDKLNAEFEAEFVPVVPALFSKEEQCFNNVAEKVKRDGGSSHYGWAVWQSDIICEGERHAVWESPEGNLVDITPRDSLSQILFISDNNLDYRGQLIDNVRINITSNKIVDDYIFLLECVELLFTYGNLINEDRIDLPEPVAFLQQGFQEMSGTLLKYMFLGGTPETECFCAKGRAYQYCHGENIKENIESHIREIDKRFPERPLK